MNNANRRMEIGSDLISFLFPEVKVGEGNAGPINVAVSPTASHPIQPAHVDASPTPETGSEDHTVVAGGHVAQVAAVIAHVEAGVLAALSHPGVGLLAVLVVGDGEGLGGVDLTSSVRTHHPVVDVESVGLTASSVAAVPVAVTPVAGVKGAGERVLVALHDVVLRAPDVVPQVGVAVVVAVPGVVPGHLDEVCCGVAVVVAVPGVVP